MATILITNGPAVAILSEPDEDGDYSWDCCCGDGALFQGIADTIADAEIHVDKMCPRRI